MKAILAPPDGFPATLRLPLRCVRYYPDRSKSCQTSAHIGFEEMIAVASWTIGDVGVTRVEEQIGFASVPPEKFLIGLDHALLEKHRTWLVPNHYAPAEHRMVTSIHSW